MNHKPVWIALAGISLGITVAAPAPSSFSLEKPFTANINLTKRETAQLHLDLDKKQLEVRVRGKTQRLEITTMDDTERGSVLVNDFNFDGYADIAIPDGIGYGGVNYFYVLYTFQPSSNHFVPVNFPGDSGGTLCNPELRVATRTIETDCKNGPRYDYTDYRFLNGKPYIYRSAAMVILDAFDTDHYLVYAVSVFNTNGKPLRSSISDDPRLETAPLRYVPVDRAYLYTIPREDARTDRYIVRNDAVRVLDVRDLDGQQWLRIAYQSRTLGRIIRWVSFNL
jgi:hypothetical protein